jgi:hypothetical protein
MDSNVVFKWFYSRATHLRIENFEETPLPYLHMAPSTIIVDHGELALPNGHRALNYPTIEDYRRNTKWLLPGPICIDRASVKPMGREIASLYGVDVPKKHVQPTHTPIPWAVVQFLRKDKGRKINDQIDMLFNFEDQEATHAQDVLDGKRDDLTCFISGIPLYGFVYAVEILGLVVDPNAVVDDEDVGDEEKKEDGVVVKTSWPTILVDSVVVEYANKQLDALKTRYKTKVWVTKCPRTVEESLPVDMDPRRRKVVIDIANFGVLYEYNSRFDRYVMYAVNPVEETVCVGCTRINWEQLRSRTDRCVIMFLFE